MNKKLLFCLASVALIAAGCGKQASAPVSSAPASPTPSQQQNQTATLKQLMMSGNAEKCVVSPTNSNSQNAGGTVYISSGKMRADFSANINGTQQTSHMINDGQYIYTWLDGNLTGMKMQDQPPQAATGTQPSTNNPSQDAQYSYSCSPWTVDNSVFILPNGVKFGAPMAMPMTPAAGQTMPRASGSSAGSVPNHTAMCAACNSAGANKAQCLAALGCK